MAFSNLVSFSIRPTFLAIKSIVERKKQRLTNMSQAYHEASIYLDQWVQDNFKTEGDKVGKWAPFAESTMLQMQQYHPNRIPPKLLQDSGTLRLSFKPFFNAKNAGIGSKLGYSKYHEFGTSRIPMRRILPKREEVIPDIRIILDRHVKEGIKK